MQIHGSEYGSTNATAVDCSLVWHRSATVRETLKLPRGQGVQLDANSKSSKQKASFPAPAAENSESIVLFDRQSTKTYLPIRYIISKHCRCRCRSRTSSTAILPRLLGLRNYPKKLYTKAVNRSFKPDPLYRCSCSPWS